MVSLKNRLTIIMVALGVTALLTTVIRANARAHPAEVVPLTELPLIIGNYSGREIPVEQSIKEILETPNVMMREYSDTEGVNIIAAIVYYPQYRVYFHMPEGCMVGRGSIIVAEEREAIGIRNGDTPFVTANKLVLKQGDGDEHVYYFFVSEDLITPSYPAVRFHLMMEHLQGRPAGAALVRFSTRVNENNSARNIQSLKSFIGEVCPLLPRYLK